jgi:hypothetical protein
MPENISWIGNQSDQLLSESNPHSGKELGVGEPSVAKPKQPFLRKGSGNVQKRLAAARERKYVPKGGFLTESTTSPTEVISHAANARDVVSLSGQQTNVKFVLPICVRNRTTTALNQPKRISLQTNVMLWPPQPVRLAYCQNSK